MRAPPESRLDLPLVSPCDLSSDADELEDDLDSYLSVGEASASEVVYVREHVCVWPSRNQRIPGRLSLVKQHCVLFMAWLPYGTGVLREDGSFHVDARGHEDSRGAAMDSTLYAIHPIPLSEIRLLRAHTPLMGPHRLDVTLISGLTLTPLHMPAQAIHTLMEVIKQHVALVASATTKGTWLVNEVADPLIRSLSALDLGDVLLGGPPRGGAQLTWAPPAPPPAAVPQPPALSNTWASWVAQTETVWDVFSVEQGTGLLAAMGTLGSTAGAGLGAGTAPTGAAPGLAGMGRAAWKALSTGLSRLVAEFPSGSFHQFAIEGEQEGGGVTGWAEQGSGFAGDGTGASIQPPRRSGGGQGGGVVGGEFVSWQAADGLGSGRRAASAACMAVGMLAHCGQATPGSSPPTQHTLPAATHAAPPLQPQQQQQGPAVGLRALPACVSPQHTSPRSPATQQTATPPGQSQPPSGSPVSPTNPSRTGRSSRQPTPTTASPAATASPVAPTSPHNTSAEPQAERLPSATLSSSSSSGSCGVEDGYEMVERSIQTLRDAHLHGPTLPPLTEDDLQAMMDAEGRLSLDRLRERCWQSGLEHGARRTAWPLLLGIRAPHHTTQQYRTAMADRRSAYTALCQQWQARIRAQEPAKDLEWWESCSRIDKDVGRTDRSHPVFASEGCAASKALRRMLLSYVTQPGARDYCQGMSDLAAPLLVVMADESEAFAAFNALMRRMGANFDSDQQGMHTQLQALKRIVQLVDPPLHSHLESIDGLSYFYCFRWLLIAFKREFKYEEVLRLWEALWCAPCSSHMQLYVAAAVLVHHRKAIMTQVHDFDGMLKFCIHLSGGLELQPLLLLGQALATYVGTAADDVLPPPPPEAQRQKSSTSGGGSQ